MAGPHTLAETENAVAARLSGLTLDYEAMAVASNLFRAANAVRNHLERSVLQPHDLTWTAFVVLWVTWIWEPIETRQIAEEGGFSKATLSGVLTTLEGRGWVTRERRPEDGRLVLVRLTPSRQAPDEEPVPAVQRRGAGGRVEPARRTGSPRSPTCCACSPSGRARADGAAACGPHER